MVPVPVGIDRELQLTEQAALLHRNREGQSQPSQRVINKNCKIVSVVSFVAFGIFSLGAITAATVGVFSPSLDPFMGSVVCLAGAGASVIVGIAALSCGRRCNS